MKLLKLPFTKRRLLAMMVGLVACGGVTQAQYTGIGHTGPDATLHIIPVNPAHEVLRVEGVLQYNSALPADVAAYDDILRYDATTGLVRYQPLAELLDETGEWIENGAGDAIIPRRYQTAMSVNNALVNIGATATTVGGTFTVTGTSTLNGATTVNNSFAVSGTNTTNLGGVVTLGTVNDLALTVNPTDQILFHGPGGVVQKADVSDVLAANGQWIIDGSGNLVPREAAYNGDIAFTGTEMDVNVNTDITGTFDVTGASTLTGTLNVTAAADFDADVNIDGSTIIDGTLDIGTVNVATTVVGLDEILFQAAGATRVQSITVTDLLANSSYWDLDSDVLTPSATAIEDEISIADQDVDITANDIDFTGTNVDVTGAFGVAGTFTVTGAGNASSVDGTMSIGTVAQVTAADLIGTDEILIQQAGTNLVEYVTVADLMSANSYWDLDSDVLTPSATAIEDEISIADGDVDITATDIDFTGTNVDVTGAFGVAGTFTVTGAGNASSVDGTMSIGTVAEISGGPLASTDEILLQRAGTNLVEYVTVEDLVASNGEWVYDSGNSRIYARRAQAAGGDVWVTDAGNHVVEIAAAYQFADNTNQVTATGIDATAAYTMNFGSTLNVNTAADADVSFNETGSSVPWMFYEATVAGEVGRVGINTNTPLATLHVAGNIVASNSTVSSDRRFKKDITEISGALGAVKAMRGVSYGFRRDEFPKENFDDNKHIGFIAQELQEVLPDAVFARADGFLTVDYAAVTPVLVEAVQELSKQVEALQAENATLRSTSEKSVGAVSTKQLRELEARLADMDARLQEVAGRK